MSGSLDQFLNEEKKNIEEHQIVKKIKVQNDDTGSDLGENSSSDQIKNQTKNSEDSNNLLSQDINIPVSTDILPSQDNKNRKKQKFVSSNFLTEYQNDPASFIDTYQVLKYKGQSYKLNDNVLIRNGADPVNDFVCKLSRIIRPIHLESSKVLAFLEVQWYYKKGDLQSKKYQAYLNHFSENEVFLTNQKDFVLVDCINGPAEVLTYEEYDSLSRINPHTFYSRSKFDVVKKRIIPPVDKWEKHCICKTPLNPDYMYVQCDKCNMWYHILCLGLTIEEAQAMEAYICKDCDNKDQTDITDKKSY